MFRNTFIHTLHKPAIADRYGRISYQALGELSDKFQKHLANNNCFNKRVLIKGNNHRYTVALLTALMENDNEVILQEPKSTSAETENLLKLYQINCIIDADDLTQNQQPVLQWGDETSHDICVAMVYYFSSGSTGQPKLFGYTAEKLIALIQAWTIPLQQDEAFVTMCPLTITHFHGTMVCFSALMYGNTLVFTHTETLDAGHLAELMETYLPTLVTGTPWMYQKLLQTLDNNFCGFRQLRYAICGSAPMSAKLAEEFHAKFNIHLHQGYGLSEIGLICIDLHPEIGLGTVGSVIPGIRYKIIDDEGNEVPTGSEGELVVRAPYMATGYLDSPEQTNEMFRDGWLFTKDVVREDALGRISIVGRKSTFINIAGFKVFPAEIEKVIMSFHPGIAVAVQEKLADGKPVIVAYFECNSFVDLDALKAFCKRSLASYKQPGEYVIVDSLPRNMIGKVRYNQIE